jgi:peptide/nickel transport system permease protein
MPGDPMHAPSAERSSSFDVLRYITGRLAQAVVTLALVATAAFMLTHLLGDPVRLLLPQTATEKQYLALRHALGYDRPLYAQYGSFIWNLLHGNLGASTTYGRSALTVVFSAMRVTLELTSLAMLVALAIGIPLGLRAGYRPNGLADRISLVLATIGLAVPGFVLAIVLILALAVDAHIFPASGWGSPKTLVLPVMSLAVYAGSIVIRVARSSMREVMSAPFITLARARGLSEAQVIIRHAFRSTMVPLVTVIGLQFATLLTGAFVIETVFSVPGMGQLAVTAIQDRDINVVAATVIVAAVGFIIVNLICDLSYTIIDPRVKRRWAGFS